ncbi:hypothetical protein A5630_24660 [Mycolicibacterium mucogenicum]|uniref:Uncharacterized protein n=1 Tax=Mycolicibacterium mucogenicum TaxID=56689 RepID=A0A1A3GX08_MYCMU|nr:hypothetical protein [Mycolicibacterium mucogenicum]OBJ40577.1 hypothetical protein A5630_24660 [Mycolicibacterium mucogenicum]
MYAVDATTADAVAHAGVVRDRLQLEQQHDDDHDRVDRDDHHYDDHDPDYHDHDDHHHNNNRDHHSADNQHHIDHDDE